jgi:hypothetical protein
MMFHRGDLEYQVPHHLWCAVIWNIKFPITVRCENLALLAWWSPRWFGISSFFHHYAVSKLCNGAMMYARVDLESQVPHHCVQCVSTKLLCDDGDRADDGWTLIPSLCYNAVLEYPSSHLCSVSKATVHDVSFPDDLNQVPHHCAVCPEASITNDWRSSSWWCMQCNMAVELSLCHCGDLGISSSHHCEGVS